MNRSWDIQERGVQSPLFVCFTVLFWNIRPKAAQKISLAVLLLDVGRSVRGRDCHNFTRESRTTFVCQNEFFPVIFP